MFWNKKPLTSDEYADMLNKHTKLSNDVLLLTAKLENIEHRFKSLHTKIARMPRENDEEEQAAMSDAELQEAQLNLLGLGRRNAKD